MKRINVLLIEDDDDDAALIAYYLSQSARDGEIFNLKCADRLASGCKLLGQEDFDAVLLDLTLPEGEGIEAFLKVRERKLDAPIIVLTGIKDESLALQALGLGAQDYLIKGMLDDRLLKRAIRYAIDRRRLLARMEALLSRDADGKLVVDRDNIVRHANPSAEAMLGRRPRELVGQAFPYHAPLEGISVVRLPASGGERFIELRGAPIDWEEESSRLVTMRDVTDAKQLELQRDDVRERMALIDSKSEFMASVSHELRNPLTTVKTALQSLRDGMVGELTGQQMRFIDLAYRNVERQIRIVNNVLDLSRLQSGRLRVEPRAVSLAQLLDEASQARHMTAGGPKLDMQLSDALPDVFADPDLVTQVLANLIDNAERFARTKVVVRASPAVHEDRPAVEISVIDDGPGMTEQQLSRLFTRYMQASRPSGGGYKGTGLGLAISKEIVTALGGRIWADSVAGKGARFHFLLPTAQETPSLSQPVNH